MSPTSTTTRRSRLLRLAAGAGAAVALTTGLTGCGDKITPSASTSPPSLVWYYYNPLTALPKGWQTQWTKSPQKVDPTKGLVVSGTGISFAGMRSAHLSATVVGACEGNVNGSIYSSNTSRLVKTADDKPATSGDKADIGAGGIISITDTEMASYFGNGLPCTLYVAGKPVTGSLGANGIRFDASVTDLGGRTTTGSFWAHR